MLLVLCLCLWGLCGGWMWIVGQWFDAAAQREKKQGRRAFRVTSASGSRSPMRSTKESEDDFGQCHQTPATQTHPSHVTYTRH